MQANPNALLDFDAAAQYLAIGERMLRRLQSQHKVAFVKVGRYVRFTQADLDDYVDKQTVPALR